MSLFSGRLSKIGMSRLIWLMGMLGLSVLVLLGRWERERWPFNPSMTELEGVLELNPDYITGVFMSHGKYFIVGTDGVCYAVTDSKLKSYMGSDGAPWVRGDGGYSPEPGKMHRVRGVVRDPDEYGRFLRRQGKGRLLRYPSRADLLLEPVELTVIE